MNTFTQAVIAALCQTAGFSVADAKVAAAIAMCEAPGTVPGTADFDLVGDQALADAVWGYSLGAFQVRSLKTQKGTGLFRDALRLPDPAFNCSSAHTIFVSSGFNAWTTYASGQYRAYLQDQFPPKPGTYVVVSGDTLSGIGRKLAVDWTEIARVNNLVSPYLLDIGQVLQLPYVDYVVQAGDTLGGIAAKHITGATWQQIAVYNHLTNPDLIYPAQKLRLPK